jgi:hypothetical protein
MNGLTTQSLKGEESFLENWIPRTSAAWYFTSVKDDFKVSSFSSSPNQPTQ